MTLVFGDYPENALSLYNAVNGTEYTNIEDLHLSDAYGGDGDIEVTAHMLNVNAGNNSELMEKCRPLSDYSEFIARVREYLKQGLDKEEATRRAIDSCIEEGIMDKLLKKERSKVENILRRGLTEEEQQLLKELQIKDARAEGVEEGIAQGIAMGETKTRMETVDLLIAKGLAKDIEEACDILDLDINEYKANRSC